VVSVRELTILRGCPRTKGGKTKMGTSKKDASKAGKLLQNPKVPKGIKSVAGSDLAQKGKGSGKKK
jgi:hypothetical protein